MLFISYSLVIKAISGGGTYLRVVHAELGGLAGRKKISLKKLALIIKICCHQYLNFLGLNDFEFQGQAEPVLPHKTIVRVSTL